MNISRRDALRLFAGTSLVTMLQPTFSFAEEFGSAETSRSLSLDKIATASIDIAGIRDQADALGVSGVNFDNLSLAGGIPTYIFNGEFFEPDIPYYPVFDGDHLALWIIDTDDGIQITNALVKEVDRCALQGMHVAVVYDKTTAYLYIEDSASFYELIKFPPMPERGEVDTSIVPDINAATFGYGGRLAIGPSVRAQYAYLTVQIVTQPSGSNLCWAASCASIANRLTGSRFTSIGVAQLWYGAINYDRTLPRSNAARVLNVLGVGSYSLGGVPSSTTVYNNLSGGYPLVGHWEYSSGNVGHATVIRGIDTASNLSLMDPLTSSFTTANRYGATWRGRSAGTGSYMTLAAATARYT